MMGVIQPEVLLLAGTDLSRPASPHWLAQLADQLAPLLGGWVRAELWGVTLVQALASAVLLLLIAAGWRVMQTVLRRWLRVGVGPRGMAGPAGPVEARSVKLAIEAAIAPASLFIWVCGGYAACTLLLTNFEGSGSVVSEALRWVRHAGSLAALFWLIFREINVAEIRLRRWAAGTASKWDDILAALIVRALRLVTPLAGLILVLPTLPISSASDIFFKEATSLVLIGAVGFILYDMTNEIEKEVVARFRVDVRDNLRARKIQTQVKVLKRIAAVAITTFTVASMLMVFDSVRQVGTSLLASAGVVGVICGFAAQRSLGAVLAGIQIALTQPIRLDDVVIVEGEWGRIEEINLTYVVVLIWDLRRLVVPINYFIEKPFQNWTRLSADLLGTVFLYTDYTVPVGELRKELDRILANSSLWDHKVKGIQVTDAKEHTLEVRVLVSAANASAAWDLRCEVREKLIDFLQRNHPQCLPRTRAEVLPVGANAWNETGKMNPALNEP